MRGKPLILMDALFLRHTKFGVSFSTACKWVREWKA